MFLVKIVGMFVPKNEEVQNFRLIEEGSVSGDCKDDSLKKQGWNREVKIG